ncbi:MAG: hypothetical protein CVT60_01110 [Actinobacteria bacterium HGW-Actinobacteria-10]|nr:MAG: hypothetical protein CVT60_01110 [Actinobacteria bacterium HGW-Actinobacteria-10]
MSKTIGAASDFYRLRITMMDQSEEPDLEWRDDILYRQPPAERLREGEAYAIEAVLLDDEEDVSPVAVYESADAAHAAIDAIQDDLSELTRSEFEARYFDPEI